MQEHLNIGLTDEERTAVCKSLRILLATTYALYLKTQNYHWNVKSREFFSYHLMFEKQYEELADAVDEIAERIRALGHFAMASFAAFEKDALIEGEEGLPSAEKMLKQLADDHETLIRFVRQQMTYVEKIHDGATSDFFNKRLAIHEKTLWMLRSHLNH